MGGLEGPLLGQFAFTLFSVVNLAVLSWPQPIGVVGIRIEDVIVGVIVGLVATWIVLPRGQLRLVESARAHARQQGQRAVAAASELITGKQPNVEQARAAHLAFARAISRFGDAVDVAYMNDFNRTANLHELSAEEAWLSRCSWSLRYSSASRIWGSAPARFPHSPMHFVGKGTGI